MQRKNHIISILLQKDFNKSSSFHLHIGNMYHTSMQLHPFIMQLQYLLQPVLLGQERSIHKRKVVRRQRSKRPGRELISHCNVAKFFKNGCKFYFEIFRYHTTESGKMCNKTVNIKNEITILQHREDNFASVGAKNIQNFQKLTIWPQFKVYGRKKRNIIKSIGTDACFRNSSFLV